MRKSDTRCESKQECSSSKADELKVEFSAEWLRIWRYERGMRLVWTVSRHVWIPYKCQVCQKTTTTTLKVQVVKWGKKTCKFVALCRRFISLLCLLSKQIIIMPVWPVCMSLSIVGVEWKAVTEMRLTTCLFRVLLTTFAPFFTMSHEIKDVSKLFTKD